MAAFEDKRKTKGDFSLLYKELDKLSKSDCNCKELMTVLLEIVNHLKRMDLISSKLSLH
jgi:hypothetical protein